MHLGEAEMHDLNGPIFDLYLKYFIEVVQWSFQSNDSSQLAERLPYLPLPWWERIQERGKRKIPSRCRVACCAEFH
jgi:hypothetical protein